MPPSRVLDGGAGPLAFFATELRRLREQEGWTQERLAEEIAYSTALVGMVETAKRNPSRDFTERCDRILNTGGALMRVWPLLSQAAYPSWFRPWVEIEREAHTLRTWEPLLIPGLLQTSDYARAILRGRPGTTPDRVEELLTARVERQARLTAEHPPLLWAVLHERVLHEPVGDSGVMHDQLGALLAAAENDHISIHITPKETSVPAGLLGAFVIAGVEGGPDTVFVESVAGGHVTDHPRDVTEACKRYEAIRSEALPARATADLIAKVMTTWKQT